MPAAALHWCALIFAMCFPGLMAWIYFVALAQGPGPGAFPAYVAGKVVQFAFPLLWIWTFQRSRLRPAVPSFTGLAFGLGFGLFVAAAIFSIYYGVLSGSRLLADTPARIMDKLVLFRANTPTRYLLLALFLAGIHSLMEEYYWRWFVFAELTRCLAVTPAIALSALAFMGHHVIVLRNPNGPRIGLRTAALLACNCANVSGRPSSVA